MRERLQKILSACGVASRRAAEGLIAAGRVTVNGETAHVGDSADPDADRILVDGIGVSVPPPVYIMLYKPRGVVTTLKDEKSRKTVRDLLPPELGRLVPVGRLDFFSEGLLIMTNDGACVNALAHPSNRVEKTYLAWVLGDIPAAMPKLTAPIAIGGSVTRPAKVRVVAGGLISVTIGEGRNRQVRRLCEHAGLRVTRLKRISEGDLELGDMKPGEWRRLKEQEIGHIREYIGRGNGEP